MSRRKNRKTRVKTKFWLLSIKDKNGIVVDVIPHSDYDTLILEGMERAKEVQGIWEIFNAYGRLVDGSRR